MNLQRQLLRLRAALRPAVNKVIGLVAIGALKLVRRFDPDRMIDFTAAVTRRIGPLFSEHRLGRANLKAAFPEKSDAEIERILGGVWENLGRVGAEFAHLDRLWSVDLDHPERGRVEVLPADAERFQRLREDGKPALIFAAHLGNWELSALAAAAHDLPSAALYRRPNVTDVDRFVRGARAANMGELIPGGITAPFKLADALERGLHVGMLVDQHFSRGVDVTFFGRTCKANPLLAKLARHFDCPVHGTRIIRLPNNRFRAELTDEIPLPRNAAGRIDEAGAMQVITATIEGWAREYPEQWLWLHRRWR